LQEFRSSGVQEFRSSGVQEFRSSGVQEFRSSGVQGRSDDKIASAKTPLTREFETGPPRSISASCTSELLESAARIGVI
jgi:hypothetical protein